MERNNSNNWNQLNIIIFDKTNSVEFKIGQAQYLHLLEAQGRRHCPYNYPLMRYFPPRMKHNKGLELRVIWPPTPRSPSHKSHTELSYFTLLSQNTLNFGWCNSTIFQVMSCIFNLVKISIHTQSPLWLNSSNCYYDKGRQDNVLFYKSTFSPQWLNFIHAFMKIYGS